MRKALLALLALAALLAASEVAFAHGGRGRVGVGIYVGPYWGPYWGPAWYYPPPYYYYPPPAPAQPQEYVERIDPSEQGYWYYCDQSRGYYPNVKECPAGWRRVAPTPPPPAAGGTN
jgi:hypothetical protein